MTFVIGSRLSEIVSALGGPKLRRGRCRAWYRSGKNPEALVIDDARGIWCDHGKGEGGGVLSLIQTSLGCSRRVAARWLADHQGTSQERLNGGRSQRAKAVEAKTHIMCALKIWSESQLLDVTLGAAYLKRRALDPFNLGHVLRFHPHCLFGDKRLPCLVGLLRDIQTNEPCGIHRTAIDIDGTKIARKMMGRAGGAAIKLTPDEDVLGGLGVAEGVETALSIVQAGWRPVWAVLSAGGMRQFSILDGIEALTLWADHDPVGLSAARSTAARWAAAGRECCVRFPALAGADFNDRTAEAANA